MSGKRPLPVQPASSARARGRSRVRRDRSKAYRRIASLETQLQETKRLYDRYRKRCQRLQKSKPDNDAENEQQINATPKTKTKLMLRNQRVSTNVKRTLLFHNTPLAATQERSRITKTSTNKQLVSKVFASKIIKKYRALKCMTPLGITPKRIASSLKLGSSMVYERAKHKNSLSEETVLKVEQFYLRKVRSRP